MDYGDVVNSWTVNAADIPMHYILALIGPGLKRFLDKSKKLGLIASRPFPLE